MNTITATRTNVGGDAHLFTWANIANGDDAAPVNFSAYADRTVQVDGTFGTGGAVVLEGSLDGTNYQTLTDPQGNQLSFTSARIESVTEATVWVRPRVTAGDGTTAINVSLLVRR